MQLILHAPFGSRINRAWGLALRKRFCRTFNFELQAAATDNGLVLSLGEQHSFPLELVFAFLTSETVKDVLTQALLDAAAICQRLGNIKGVKVAICGDIRHSRVARSNVLLLTTPRPRSFFNWISFRGLVFHESGPFTEQDLSSIYLG